MNDWQGKIWGNTKCLVESPFYSRHELELEVGGVCSFHFHNNRANLFKIESGIVRIVWVYAWRIESVILTSGNHYDIPSLVPHQFQIFESGKMFEVYYSDRGGEVENGDIVRLTHGCKVDVEHMRSTVGIIKSDGNFWEIPD